MDVSSDHLFDHGLFLRRLARALASDPHEADEIEQRTWLAALHSPPRQPAAWRTWLRRVALNAQQRIRRGEGRRRKHEAARALDSLVPTPAELLEREALLRRVVDAVSSLDEPYRTVVWLRFWDDLPPREIADRLHEPVETVRTRLKRALAILRGRLTASDRTGWWTLASIPALRPSRSRSVLSLLSESLSAAGVFMTLSKNVVIITALAATVLTGSLIWLGTVEDEAIPDPAPRSTPEVSTLPGSVSERAAAEQPLPPARMEGSPAPTEPAGPDVETEPPTGSLSIEVVREDEGRPVPHAMVIVARRLKQGTEILAHEETDEAGRLRLEGLPVGVVRVSTKAARREEVVEVRQSEVVEVKLVCPSMFSVHGLVVDPAGEPLSGAEVWKIERSGQHHPGRRLRLTDAQGWFEIDGLLGTDFVYALHRDFAISEPLALKDHEPDETGAIRLELRMFDVGGRLRGVVVDASDRPVPDAEVLVEGGGSGRNRRPDSGAKIYPPVGQASRTDAEGRFTMEAVPPGVPFVQVRAEGFAPWSENVHLEAGGEADVRVRLEAFAVVEGTIRDSRGAPIPDLLVLWTGQSLHGQTHARTDAEGRYRLEGVGTGEVTLFTVGWIEEVQADRTLRAGERHEWSPTLAAPAVVEGRILDERGQPLVSWRCRGKGAAAMTDDEGHFRLSVVGSEAIRLLVESPATDPFPVTVVGPVAPDSEPIDIVIRDDQLPTATLRGRFVSPIGVAGDQLTVTGRPLGSDEADDTSITRYYDLSAEGHFELSPIPPGHYRLTLRQKGGLVHEHDLVSLRPREVRDLGEIELMAPGFVTVELRGLEPATGRALLSDVQHGRVFFLRSEGGRRVSGPIPPGIYTLWVRGRGLATDHREVEVGPAETQHVVVVTEPGQSVRVRLSFPGSEEASNEPTPERRREATRRLISRFEPRGLVTTSSGEVVEEASFQQVDEQGEAWCELGLRPGRYWIEIQGAEGLRASGELVVVSESVSEPYRFHLR